MPSAILVWPQCTNFSLGIKQPVDKETDAKFYILPNASSYLVDMLDLTLCQPRTFLFNENGCSHLTLKIAWSITNVIVELLCFVTTVH